MAIRSSNENASSRVFLWVWIVFNFSHCITIFIKSLQSGMTLFFLFFSAASTPASAAPTFGPYV